MKAIVVTDQAAGTAGEKLVERPEPQARKRRRCSDSCVGFHRDELTPPVASTWTDRVGRDRDALNPDTNWPEWSRSRLWHAGLRVDSGCRPPRDWYRDGTWREYVAVAARNLTRRPGDVDSQWARPSVMPGLTAWRAVRARPPSRGARDPRARCGRRSVRCDQPHVSRRVRHGTGPWRRRTALGLRRTAVRRPRNGRLEEVGDVDLVFDVIGGASEAVRGPDSAGGKRGDRHRTTEARPLRPDYRLVSYPIAPLSEPSSGSGWWLRQNMATWLPSNDAVAAFNRTSDRGKDDHPTFIVRTGELPHAPEGALQAAEESSDVEHDYADRFVSHA